MNKVNVDARARALSAFRVLSNGEGRQYTATTFRHDPYRGCALLIRQASAVGYLSERVDEPYAILDVLDENGDIIQDYMIPSSTAFNWWRRKLHLAVEDE